MILIYIIEALLTLVLIPVFGTLYISKVQGLTTGKWWVKYSYGNTYFWVILVLIGGVIFIRFISISPEPPSKQLTMEFLNGDLYHTELSAKLEQLSDTLYVNNSLKDLSSKFEHAQYAWSKKDYNEVIITLENMNSGYDRHGSLPKIESFVILNNLGVAYFMRQRNKDFHASLYLGRALLEVSNNRAYEERIRKNYENLNEMVNTLD